MRTTFTLFSLFLILSLGGQITYKNNCIRSGDQIVKQQVEYKDPGRNGENVLWDFSKLKSVKEQYKVAYTSPRLVQDSLYLMGRDTFDIKQVQENDLIIDNEHFTQYYYQVKEGRLTQLGHRNAVSELFYDRPIPSMPYPFHYKQKVSEEYRSQAIYSGTEKTYLSGKIEIEADAEGRMILPNKDTLQYVIRILTTQTMLENADSLNKKYEQVPQDKRHLFKTEPYKATIKTYRWYVKGYRYPIFETVQNVNINDSLESIYFATAFFFPPQEHYYLENDAENLAVLDSLDHQTQPNEPDPNSADWLAKNFSYNFHPNPVSTDLHIEYALEESANVKLSLYRENSLLKAIPVNKKQAGVYHEAMNVTGLLPGTYVLRIEVNNQVISNVILKR